MLHQADVAKANTRLRENNFDGLRLLLALMVVFFHIGVLTRHPSLAWMRGISATFAVQAFFVVSGFLVTMSYENTSSLASYSKRRAVRIVPAYICVVLGASVALVLLSDLSMAEYFGSSGFWKYLAANLTLVNFLAPTLPGVFSGNPETVVNGSLWTIKIEAAFYLCVPASVAAVRRWGYRRVLGLAVVASVAWQLAFQLRPEFGAALPLSLAKQLPGQIAFFAGGAWLYYRVREGWRPSAWLAAAGLCLYASSSGVWNLLIAPFAATMIVAWIAVGAPMLPRTSKYGDFSYGIYLVHFPIIQVAISLGLFQSSPVVACLLVLLLIGLLSVFSWYAIEAPWLGVARRLPANRETARELALGRQLGKR